MSVNYDYVVQTAISLNSEKKPEELVCLDFGCGAGQVVAKGLEQGINFLGADPYPENRSEHYEAAAIGDKKLKDHIHKIENDTLPFPDNHFDVITSNVVFEHIKDLKKPLSEIHRVLKPGGYFLCLFPTRETWWEGHVKLYFAHWLNPPSKACHIYLKTMKTLGLGLKANDNTPEEWAQHYKHYLHEYCFYRSKKEITGLWKAAFGRAPVDHAEDYMHFRFERSGRLKKLLPFLKNKVGRFFLRQACTIRAGQILLVQKDNV